MRRTLLAPLALAAVLAPAAASAKLPYFGLDVAPIHPRVGEPITITMTCYHDEARTIRSSSCFGAGESMAWIHPLDREGELDRRDWIPVKGHSTASGVIRGRIALQEPGAYDVRPLWRTWSGGPRTGFPGVIRIEVTQHGSTIPWVLAGMGTAGACLGLVARRQRRLARGPTPSRARSPATPSSRSSTP
jgi:hypothetical protein